MGIYWPYFPIFSIEAQKGQAPFHWFIDLLVCCFIASLVYLFTLRLPGCRSADVLLSSFVSPKLTRFPQAHSTDVLLSSLCPPRRWSGAGVGVKMLRGAGGSLT